MGDKIKELFKKHDNECASISNAMSAKYRAEHDKLKTKYIPNGIWGEGADYKGYRKAVAKLESAIEEETDYLCRNALGGGIGNLEDIYDALYRGKLRDSGGVMYGHGGKYYSSKDQRAHEILANYGTLSVAHPELLGMLVEDKPELVEALREVVKEMLAEVK